MTYDSRSNSSLPQPIRNQVNMLAFSGNLMGSIQTLMTPSQTEPLSFASDSKLVTDRTRNASRKRPYPTLVAGLAGSKDLRISHKSEVTLDRTPGSPDCRGSWRFRFRVSGYFLWFLAWRSISSMARCCRGVGRESSSKVFSVPGTLVVFRVRVPRWVSRSW